MSYNKATLVVMGLLLVLAVVYGIEALSYQDMRHRNSIGPGYFPVILAVALGVLSVISAIQTLAREDRPVEIPNLGLVGLTIVLAGAFLIVWSSLDLFYAGGFVLLLALMSIYDPVRSPRRILRNLVVAAAVILFTRLLFGAVIHIRF